MKVHLDTDLGGDIDDLAALAMLLKWPGAELTGITTVAEAGGRRAGYATYALRLAGREEIPITAGADVSDGCYRFRPGYYPEHLFWPEPIVPAPGEVQAALSLLKYSIEQGAAVVGIGPCTNLALLDRRYPGIMRQTQVYLVGGYVSPPRPSRSAWGNDMDYNFQLDVDSAHHVLIHGRPTLIPLHATAETSLRRAHLPALQATDPLGALLAHQAQAFDAVKVSDGKTLPDLPEDFINHLYDPLGCAVALGWDGAVIEEMPLRVTVEEGWLHERVAHGGQPIRVVTRVHGQAFDDLWLAVVTA